MPFNAKDYTYKGFIVSEIEPGFINVQLDNPASLNAFNDELWASYGEIFTKLDADPDTNIILVTSTSPRSFSSGLDLKSAMKTFGAVGDINDDKKRYAYLRDHIDRFQEAIGTPARINTPTIGVLNGINFGLALDMASAYSIRIATGDAKFSIREIKIGIAADIGSLQRMPAVVNNKSLLFQHALLGDNFDAAEALNMGFVSKVFADQKTAIEYAKDIGSDINGNKQWAIKTTKSFIQERLDGVTTEQGLKNVAHSNAIHINGDFLQSMASVKL